MVMIDHYTKFAEAVPCGDCNAEQVCELLIRKWFSRYGPPTYVQSDNAPNFAAEMTERFMEASFATYVHSTPLHPGTQGLVERENRTLKNLLKVFGSRYIFDWDKRLDEVLGIYNATVHATTGVTPYQLVSGQKKATPLSFYFPEFLPKRFRTHQNYISNAMRRQQELHQLVQQNTQQAQRRQKRYFDQRPKDPVAFIVGDKVWRFCERPPQRYQS